MNVDHDPRVYFAAERTLLAWLRSGIAVIGLGFVVARFGLFLRMLREPGAPVHPSWASTILGSALVLAGSVVMFVAAGQHFRFMRELGAAERPRSYWMWLPLLFALAIGSIGLLLAMHLNGRL
jgi:putative membrane protein